jgi:hypothetical protein
MVAMENSVLRMNEGVVVVLLKANDTSCNTLAAESLTVMMRVATPGHAGATSAG